MRGTLSQNTKHIPIFYFSIQKNNYNKKNYYYFFKIIFLWFLFPSLLLQNSRSVSLFGLTSTPHSLSLKVFSLFLAVSIFSKKIRDTHWRFSVHVWLLRSLSIDWFCNQRWVRALNLFRSLSLSLSRFFLSFCKFLNSRFSVWFSCVSDSLIHRQFKNAVRFSVWFSRKRRKTKKNETC